MGSMMLYVHAQMVVFSGHAQDALCSVHMCIGLEGQSMSIHGCSVCMHIIFVNSRFWGAKYDSVPYMVKVIFTHCSM